MTISCCFRNSPLVKFRFRLQARITAANRLCPSGCSCSKIFCNGRVNSIDGTSELIRQFQSLRVKRSNLPLWNQPLGDCFVAAFLDNCSLHYLPPASLQSSVIAPCIIYLLRPCSRRINELIRGSLEMKGRRQTAGVAERIFRHVIYMHCLSAPPCRPIA